MEAFEIKWTFRAKKDLRRVYDFYSELAGEEKAFEMISQLLERVDILSDSKFVAIGVVDETFEHFHNNYKKLIFKNIKITYRQSKSKPYVYINRVFDMRQHPSKNK
jgi:plasmid stabilization system protein ParE